MSNYYQAFKNSLDTSGIRYTEDQPNNALCVVYSGENMTTIRIFAMFGEDNSPRVTFFCWDIAAVPTEKRARMLEVCNTLNDQSDFVCFCLKDGMIHAQLDTLLEPRTCGVVCSALLKRLVSTLDEAYPAIQKGLWA